MLSAGSSGICNGLGPVFDFVNFMLYATVASLAHYSLHRLHNRAIDKLSMFKRYACFCFVTSAVLSAVVGFSMVWRNAHGTGYKLQHGMCAVTGSHAVVAITVLERFFDVYLCMVVVLLSQQVAAQHSPVVLRRQQRVSCGYILVALAQGACFWAPSLFAWIFDLWLDRPVKSTQFAIGLCWPIGNFIVYTCASQGKCWGDTEDGAGEGTVKVVGFEIHDSQGTLLNTAEERNNVEWRALQDKTIEEARERMCQELMLVIPSLVSNDAPDSFPIKVTKSLLSKYTTDEARDLLRKHAEGDLTLRRFVDKSWHETKARFCSILIS